MGVVEESGKEPNVPERRSVLRGFKKFFAKKETGSCEEYMHEILRDLCHSEISDLKHYITVCRKSQSAVHPKKQPHRSEIREEEKFTDSIENGEEELKSLN